MTTIRRRPVIAAFALLVAFAAALPFLGAGRAGAADSQVYVVHGIPGVTADVYAGGNLVIPGFAPTTIAGPLPIPAGDLPVQVFAAIPSPPATAAARVDAAVITQTLTVPSGANVSVVANISPSGTPNLFAFANDLSAVPEGSSRVTVRHVAQAPTVDIAVNGSVAIPGLAPQKEASAVLPAGTYDVAVQAGGQTVLDLPGTTIPAGKNVIVYAVGSATADPATLSTIVQVLDVPTTPAPQPEAPAGQAPATQGPAPVMASPRMTG